jgi:hypothetical protein
MLLIELFSRQSYHQLRLVGAERHHVVTSLPSPFFGTDPLGGDGQNDGLLLSEVGP